MVVRTLGVGVAAVRFRLPRPNIWSPLNSIQSDPELIEESPFNFIQGDPELVEGSQISIETKTLSLSQDFLFFCLVISTLVSSSNQISL